MLRASIPAIGLGLAVALATGCTVDTGDSTVLVLRNQAPMSGCIIPADITAASISGGYYDLGEAIQAKATAVNFGYLLTPLLQNESVADTANQAAVGRRTFIVEGAHVDVTFNDDVEFSVQDQADLKTQGLTHFDARFAGAVTPNGGLSAFNFEIVPAALMNKILDRHKNDTTPFASIGMVAKVVVFGTMGGGTTDSAEFDYPVTVCDSCLVNDVGLCSTVTSSFMARLGGACFTNQDGVIDCCTDDTTKALVCPAVAPPTGA